MVWYQLFHKLGNYTAANTMKIYLSWCVSQFICICLYHNDLSLPHCIHMYVLIHECIVASTYNTPLTHSSKLAIRKKWFQLFPVSEIFWVFASKLYSVVDWYPKTAMLWLLLTWHQLDSIAFTRAVHEKSSFIFIMCGFCLLCMIISLSLVIYAVDFCCCIEDFCSAYNRCTVLTGRNFSGNALENCQVCNDLQWSNVLQDEYLLHLNEIQTIIVSADNCHPVEEVTMLCE